MKKIFFVVLTFLIPLLALLLAEGLLRIFIPGTPPPMIRELGTFEGDRFMLFDRTGPASFFGPQADRLSPVDITGFFMPKPTNTIRIILTGESAMRGFPQPDAFNAETILRAMLKDDYPDQNIEVLNFAATAVASYPVYKITEAALACDPDVIVALAGHNEYFGAYGVFATRHIASQSGLFDWDYKLKHSALGRLAGRIASVFVKPQMENKQLMEMMATQDSVPHDAPAREKALANFQHHMNLVASSCKSAGIPLVLCIPPSNETDLRPIGPDEDSGLVNGRTARQSFEAGRLLLMSDGIEQAETLFQDARDRDAMPWRASTLFQDMLREIGRDHQALLCDLDAAFRTAGGTNGIGWNLMDDHVHPSIDGQSVMADSIRQSLHQIFGPPDPNAPTKSHQEYLEALGDNMYDRLSVSSMMVTLFQIPFLAESNPEAISHFNRVTRSYLSKVPRETAPAVYRWQQTPTLSIGKRPLSGLAAIEWLKHGRQDQAIPLLRSAIHSVPDYSSWSLEYTYFLLAALRQTEGELSDNDYELAGQALTRGQILTRLGDSKTGQSERFMGRILQVLDREEEAIPYLKTALKKLNGIDRVATQSALVQALTKTGRAEEAQRLKQDAAGRSGSDSAK